MAVLLTPPELTDVVLSMHGGGQAIITVGLVMLEALASGQIGGHVGDVVLVVL